VKQIIPASSPASSPAERDARAAAILRDLQVRAAAVRRARLILAGDHGHPSIAQTRAQYELARAERATLGGAA